MSEPRCIILGVYLGLHVWHGAVTRGLRRMRKEACALAFIQPFNFLPKVAKSHADLQNFPYIYMNYILSESNKNAKKIILFCKIFKI